MHEQPVNTSEKRLRLISRLKKAFGGLAIATTLIMPIPSSTSKQFNYEPPSIGILNQDQACPEDAELAVLNIPGVGMNTIGDYAGQNSKEILSDSHKACFASLRPGNTYNTEGNAAAFDEFLNNHSFSNVAIFAHSFGGIDAVNILNKYIQKNPDDNTRFTVAFFSTPGGRESLPLHIEVGALIQSTIPMSEEFVYAQHFIGISLQRKEGMPYGQIVEDAKQNAKDSPPLLIKGQTTELLTNGMQAIDPRINAQFVFIGDHNDQIVNTATAPYDIERRLGRQLNKIFWINHSNGELSSHAALWWAEYKEDYKKAVREVASMADQELAA